MIKRILKGAFVSVSLPLLLDLGPWEMAQLEKIDFSPLRELMRFFRPVDFNMPNSDVLPHVWGPVLTINDERE